MILVKSLNYFCLISQLYSVYPKASATCLVYLNETPFEARTVQ